jgi:hypothetical protein
MTARRGDAADLGAVTYPQTINPDFGNPLGGRPAFSARNASYPGRDRLVLDFGTQLAGQQVRIRFRIGTDLDYCCAGTGWELDDFVVNGIDNTPFPAVVPDAETCSAPAAGSEPTVVRTVAPRRALAPAARNVFDNR